MIWFFYEPIGCWIARAAAVMSVGRMSEADRCTLAIGLRSNAVGLAVGYGVARIRR